MRSRRTTGPSPRMAAALVLAVTAGGVGVAAWAQGGAGSNMAATAAGPRVTLTDSRSRLCLDGPARAGEQVRERVCDGSARQQWSVEDAGQGRAVLVNAASGLVLDGERELRTAGARVIVWPRHGRANQQWVLPAAGSPGRVRSAHSGLALRPRRTAAAEKPVVQAYDNGRAPDWRVVPVAGSAPAPSASPSGSASPSPSASRITTPGPSASAPAPSPDAGEPSPTARPGAVTTAAALVRAVNEGAAGATVDVGAGTFELTAPLRPKKGMTIRGAGAGRTVLRNAPSWAPGNAGLDRDEGATAAAIDCGRYLVDLGRDTATGVTVSGMTLTGPRLHGGICGFGIDGLELSGLEFKDFLWAGVRTYIMKNATIHDNVFVDAGGRSGITTGEDGGGLFLTYTSASQIFDNRFSRARTDASHHYIGIKGREARDVRIHHNTIDTAGFSIEFPFENDWKVEIDHNVLHGPVSVPKHSGGAVPAGGHTFHVHHNYFRSGYSFEFQRNAMKIDHNLFDFSASADGSNLISGFDVVPADRGGTQMHDNLIRNPGLGLYWNEGVYNNFSFHNNHVKGQTTVTPRREGLFDFRPSRNGAVTDWTTIQIRNNVIELTGVSRPLMRNAESHAAVIENNTLTNISDAGRYANRDTGAPRGPRGKLAFTLGADGEYRIDDWTLSRT